MVDQSKVTGSLRPRPLDEPNSNLRQPKLSYDHLLGQTSNLGCDEPIN